MPDALADELGWSPQRLEILRRQYRMEHGTEAEVKLRSYLLGLVEWKRRQDQVRLLGRRSGYVETRFAAIQVRGTQNEEEPESVPEDYQNQLSMDSRARRALESERVQRDTQAQIRSVTEALRAKARRGEDLSIHLAKIARELRMDDAA